MEYLGTETGGRHIKPGMLDDVKTMFSFGAGEDISFELECLNRGIKVHCFDPTPKSIEYMKGIQHENLFFYPMGISDRDGLARFYYPKNPDYASCSITNFQGTDEYFIGEVQSLETILYNVMDIPDLIKMDIEGAEYSVIDSMFKLNPYQWPDILMVEFHGKKKAEYVNKLKGKYKEVYQNNHDYLFL